MHEEFVRPLTTNPLTHSPPPTMSKRATHTHASPACSDLPVTYVDDEKSLGVLCAHLATVQRFALDTEFVGERTYTPQLELIQVATTSQVALIDCRAVPSLQGFFVPLCDEHIDKILHAGQQDLGLFENLIGRVPTPVVDTQVASAMAGYGAQPGYAQLVEGILGLTMEKTETLTDWSRRPLTPAQLSYAADDVRYLLPLYEGLRLRLTGLDRWEWLREECRMLTRSTRRLSAEPENAYLRVRGRGSLRAKGLAVLRELAAWREEVARHRNKPRPSVARDEALVEIARKAPTTTAALRGLRAVRSRELERHADDVVCRVARALEGPKELWPQPPAGRGRVPQGGTVELLQAALRARADEAGIAPSLIATHADLQLLAQRHAAGQVDDLPVVRGWRRAIAGSDLLALLDGCASVALDAATGQVKIRTKER